MMTPSGRTHLSSARQPTVPIADAIGDLTCSPKSVTTSDSKHQSAPDQHWHKVDHSTRRMWGEVELANARETVQNDVEVAVPQ